MQEEILNIIKKTFDDIINNVIPRSHNNKVINCMTYLYSLPHKLNFLDDVAKRFTSNLDGIYSIISEHEDSIISRTKEELSKIETDLKVRSKAHISCDMISKHYQIMPMICEIKKYNPRYIKDDDLGGFHIVIK